MITYSLKMSKTEVKPITIRVRDLKTGETVSDANIKHTPPSGGSPLTISDTITTPYIDMSFGPFAVQGKHYVLVQAVGSAGSKPEVLYDIEVTGDGIS